MFDNIYKKNFDKFRFVGDMATHKIHLFCLVIVGTGVLDCPFFASPFLPQKVVVLGQSRTPVPTELSGFLIADRLDK